MADEAHRSQYGFVEGGARWMREALPNATFVGFTGTPLERDDKNTIHVFGEYADVYDIRQAVEDGATRPLYYESRIVKLKVDEEGARVAEEEVEYVVNADRKGDRRRRTGSACRWSRWSARQERIERLAAFIVEHWEKRRAAMEGKAMVVTMSRDIAARLYEAIRALRPDWHDADDERGAMKVVVTGTNDDPEPLRSHVRTKAARKRLAERFKAPDDDLRLVIVCDMWLTGFDCPPAHTMYLDKPLAGHNLMQAIARVNRVYGDKPGGLIVDLLGLADQLADALATYTQAGGTGEAVRKVQDEAVPAMQAAFEKLRGFFHGCDYEQALGAAPQAVLPVYLRAIDHVFGQNEGWKRLRTLVKELSAAFALAVPRPETEAITPHLAFFQRVVAMIRKRLADDDGSRRGPRPPARHRRRGAPGDRRRGRCRRGDRLVRRRRAGRGPPRHPQRRVPGAGGCAGAEEPGAGNAAQAAERPDPHHRAHEPRAEQEVPRGARRRHAALHEQGDHHRRDDLAADRSGEAPARRAERTGRNSA